MARILVRKNNGRGRIGSNHNNAEAADPIQVESIKVPRSVLMVLSVVAAKRFRSRSFVIREVLSLAAADYMKQAEVKTGVEERAAARVAAGKNGKRKKAA